jgi:hypothetical protein
VASPSSFPGHSYGFRRRQPIAELLIPLPIRLLCFGGQKVCEAEAHICARDVFDDHSNPVG